MPTTYDSTSGNSSAATIWPYPRGSSEVPVAATTAATCSPMDLATAFTSSDGWRVLAGLEKSVSVGQKIGHIIGCPARLLKCASS
ncbi:hypothetical protein [Trebonia kvetii]|uniref:hypothetical protein n=1 Tax=Trebonia kvetii TaxID=2480626 RepID=UPI0016520463|nr:hypothetical protein [Trebonia kvetii]